MDFALDYLERNHICKHFVLFENQFKTMKKVKRLCQIISEHPAIETLNLRHIVGGHGGMANGYPMLKMIITAGKHKLKSLDMQGNNIKSTLRISRSKILQSLKQDSLMMPPPLLKTKITSQLAMKKKMRVYWMH